MKGALEMGGVGSLAQSFPMIILGFATPFGAIDHVFNARHGEGVVVMSNEGNPKEDVTFLAGVFDD